HPNVSVIVLSQYAGAGYALALLEDGAEGRGYLLKERVHDRNELLAAIEVVAQGGTTIDPSLIQELLAADRMRHSSPLDALPPRRTTPCPRASARPARRWPRPGETLRWRSRSSSPSGRSRSTSGRFSRTSASRTTRW